MEIGRLEFSVGKNYWLESGINYSMVSSIVLMSIIERDACLPEIDSGYGTCRQSVIAMASRHNALAIRSVRHKMRKLMRETSECE